MLGSIHESVFIVHFDALLEERGKGELIYYTHAVEQTLGWAHLYVTSFASLRYILIINAIFQQRKQTE